MSQSRYLVAGPLRLDRKDERLWRDGSLVRLGGKATALLRALMERPQTLVTKDDLFDSVWAGLAVSDSVLTTAVKEVRQALGDDARKPRLVETVHGRGYRFLLPVEAQDEGPAAASGKPAAPRLRRLGLPAALAAFFVAALAVAAIILLKPGSEAPPASAALAAHPQSIAVLPFDDLSPARDQGWFAAGLTEEILNSLARTPDLRVAARTSTIGLPPGDVRQVGRRLNVAHVLEGSVRREGGRVRVTAQLIRASDGFHIWSQNYDRAASDVIPIQEDIAIAIARALKTVMSPQLLREMVTKGTRSVEAYEEYLKALAYDQQHLETGDAGASRRADEAYERARRLDPSFAAAHWAAAQGWFGNATRVAGAAPDNAEEEQRRLREYMARVDAAIAASGGRAENLKYRSARAMIQLQFREAVRLMQLYLLQRPRDIEGWTELVDLAGYAGDRPLMARAAERIHTLSIESGSPRSRAITASVQAMDIANAVVRARQQLALRPGEALIQYQAHRALLWGGRTGEARIILARLRGSSLPADNLLLAELRQTCAEGGRGAREIAARIDRHPQSSLSTRWQAAELLGDRARAASLLKPLDRPERLTTLIQYLIYPNFDSSHYPLLQARLRADGIDRPPPVRIPAACG